MDKIKRNQTVGKRSDASDHWCKGQENKEAWNIWDRKRIVWKIREGDHKAHPANLREKMFTVVSSIRKVNEKNWICGKQPLKIGNFCHQFQLLCPGF